MRKRIVVAGIRVGIGLARVLYGLIKLFPTRNKVTFISRQSDDVPIDFVLLSEELSSRAGLQVKILCRSLGRGLASIGYLFHMVVQMYHIATSRVVVLDSYCIPVCILNHKKTLTVIQMWHALGSFKKFGYSILGKAESSTGHAGLDAITVSKAMHMHENYDIVIASNQRSGQYFAEAFNCDPDKVLVCGLPRVDLLVSKEKRREIAERIYAAYPVLKEKPTIIFAPTFRRDDSIEPEIRALVDAIDHDRYTMILAAHPLTTVGSQDPRVLYLPEFSTMELLFVSDYLVTDYSAILYEMYALEKPVFLYQRDEKAYEANRGFYVSPSEFPSKRYSRAQEIMKAIESQDYDLGEIRRFIADEGLSTPGNTERMVSIITERIPTA